MVRDNFVVTIIIIIEPLSIFALNSLEVKLKHFFISGNNVDTSNIESWAVLNLFGYT